MKRYRPVFSRIFRCKPRSWREVFEDLRVLKSLFRGLVLTLTGGLTKEYCIAYHLFGKEVYRIWKRSGALFLALYIKQARVALQRYVAQDSVPVLSLRSSLFLSPYVSLTRCGLPRIIPSFHRRRIRDRDVDIIRLYMSLFSLSKLIPKVSDETFKSISDTFNVPKVRRFVEVLSPMVEMLLKRYVPSIVKIPLHQGITFQPTWKSVPSTSLFKAALRAEEDRTLRGYANYISCFPVIIAEMSTFQTLMRIVHMGSMSVTQGMLWYKYTRYPFDPANEVLSGFSLDRFWASLSEGAGFYFMPSLPSQAGRLCASCTGDGKRRVFAIGNYVIQRLLAPLHDWLCAVLARIPMDGTYNQTRPLDRLKGTSGFVSSVDLKAATAASSVGRLS